MTNDRRIAAGLLMLAAATVLLVVGGVDGPVRSVLSLVFMLVAPGLALCLLMGPMSIEARLLVSFAGSAASVTTVSVALVATDVWSAGLGLVVLAAFVSIVALHVLRFRPPVDDPTAREPDEDWTDLPQETARRIT